MSSVRWVEDHEKFLEIIENNNRVVTDFTAPNWCRPCQQFMPHFDKAAEAGLDNTVFVAVDVDKAPWAMEVYGVQGVPTVMLFDRAGYVKNIVGRTVVQLLNELR